MAESFGAGGNWGILFLLSVQWGRWLGCDKVHSHAWGRITCCGWRLVPKSLPQAGGTYARLTFICKIDAHGMFLSELKAVILLGKSQEFSLGFLPRRESSSRHRSHAVEIILGRS